MLDLIWQIPPKIQKCTFNTNYVFEIGRGVRGYTRLDEVWNMPKGERIMCEFNEQCQPIKAEGRLLTRFIGTVVRKPNLAPLDVKDWHRMPKEKKEEMWNIVEV